MAGDSGVATFMSSLQSKFNNNKTIKLNTKECGTVVIYSNHNNGNGGYEKQFNILKSYF